MKTRSCSSILVTTLFALAIWAPVVSQEQHQFAAGETSHGVAAKEHHHYKLFDMGTFGGPESWIVAPEMIGSPNQMNRHGATVGAAGTPIRWPVNFNPVICGGFDGIVQLVNHALKWQNGSGVRHSRKQSLRCSRAPSTPQRGLPLGAVIR
jgi:hypothetical protein